MYGNFTWSSHDMVQYNSGLNSYMSFYTKSDLSKTHSIANSVILAQHGVQVILSQLTLDDCLPCCRVDGRNVFTKQRSQLVGICLQLSRSQQSSKSFVLPNPPFRARKPCIISLVQVNDLRNTQIVGNIKSVLGHFPCLFLKSFVWWFWVYMVLLVLYTVRVSRTLTECW